MRSTKFLKIFILFLILSFGAHAKAWNTPQQTSRGNRYQAWTWTGAGGNSSWTNGNNWCGSYLSGQCRGQTGGPPSDALVIFDQTCQTYSNCNVTLPAGTVTLKGLLLASGFNGTITQGATNLVLGASGFHQYSGTFSGGAGSILVQNANLGASWIMTGGTFTGGSGDITVAPSNSANAATFKLSGGTFTSTTGVLRLMIQLVDFNGVSFNANGGTVEFEPTVQAMDLYPSPTVTFYHVRYTGNSSRAIRMTPSATAEVRLNGNLYFNPTAGIQALGGKLVVNQGHVIHTGAGVFGSTFVKLVANTEQQIDSSAATDKTFPGLELAHSTIAGSGKLIGDITFTGGIESALSLGTFSVNGAAVTLSSFSLSTTYNTTFIQFPSLKITGRADRVNFGTVTSLGDVTIDPDTTSTNASNSTGRVYVGGNLIVGGANAFAHRAVFELNGGSAQAINFTGSSRTVPSLAFSNSSSGVTFGQNDVTFSSGLQRISGSVTLPTTARFDYVINSTIEMPSVSFTNVVLLKDSSIYLNSDFVISGNLTIGNTAAQLCSTSNGSKILLSGNLSNTAGLTGGYYGNTIALRFVGSTQTFNFSNASDTTIFGFEMASSTSLTIQGNIRLFNGGAITYVSGAVAATSASLKLEAASSTVPFTLMPGSVQFNNVDMLARNVTISGSALIVRGNLTLAATSASTRSLAGNINVYGNLSASGSGMDGTATLTLLGNSSSLTHTATAFPTGTVTVNKTAGQVVTLASSVTLNAGQTLTLTSGQVDIAAASQTLNVPGTLTLGSSTTVKLSSGTLVVNGSTVPVGSYGGGTILP